MSAALAQDALLRDAYAHCDALARAHERDRWLAALFAPEAARQHLHALAAFDFEVGRVRDITREPLAGEMRLAWWREALAGTRAEEAAGHPVAAALDGTIARFGLPRAAFDNLLSARAFDLYNDPMPTLNDLEGYCGETSSALFQMAALVLGEGRDLGAAEASGHAGVAAGIVEILRGLPRAAARGQVYAPKDVLARNGASADDVRLRRASAPLIAALGELRANARRHLSEAETRARALPRALAPAFLPLTTIGLSLGRLERAAAAPFADIGEPPQWRRQLALWRSARGL